MSKAPKKADNTESFEFKALQKKTIIFSIIGESPMIMHRFDQKAVQELLCPSPTKNKAERAQSLKHDPVAEYRGCFYRNRDPKAPTLFHIPAGMMKGAIANAALDIPGATKASIDRLVTISSPDLFVYGIPSIYCAMTRNSDMARTPDVRTRPIFKRWAVPNVSVSYISNVLTESAVLNLVAAGGMIVGMGDWRPQRKGGLYGRFRIAEQNDPELKDILKTEARSAQYDAFHNPEEYDQDTEDLLSWFYEEVGRRERFLPSALADDPLEEAAE